MVRKQLKQDYTEKIIEILKYMSYLGKYSHNNIIRNANWFLRDNRKYKKPSNIAVTFCKTGSV